MLQKAVHIFIIISLIALVGCNKATEEDTDDQPLPAVLYENPDQGVRVLKTDGWVVEKETATSVQFKNENIVAIISVIPNEETGAEIKQELLSAAGEITVTGEGPNYISWKSERSESIQTNVYINQKQNRNVITTFLTPLSDYENNREEIEAFRWHVELY
ncbi:hypothetical protein RJD24_19780 [Bacillaceae bacterium IKA-2]|nr:hypothetical protein RJD24_19780 [Bacillaceae bacterium IKA-2]